MIPELTLDIESITKNWEGNEESIEWVKNYCKTIYAENSSIPLYLCDDSWVKLEVFNEYKDLYKLDVCHIYGYCDTEESLIKYLQKYVDDQESNYFVHIGFMSMDYEKYYKNGSYINKNGIDTKTDYYSYIDEHPEMEVKQDIDGKWITFTIFKLKS